MHTNINSGHWIILYCSASCCARDPAPMSRTACTTVVQVRGRSPVPSLWHTQSSTSCNIHAPTFVLSLSIPSMMAGCTCRNVPNALQSASSWWVRARITSKWVRMCTKLHSNHNWAPITFIYTLACRGAGLMECDWLQEMDCWIFLEPFFPVNSVYFKVHLQRVLSCM